MFANNRIAELSLGTKKYEKHEKLRPKNRPTRDAITVHVLVGYEVPREQYDAVDGYVDRQIIRVTLVVAVHRANHSFAGSDQQARRTVDVVRPARQRLLPYRYDCVRAYALC